MKRILFVTNSTQSGAPISLLQLVSTIHSKYPDWRMSFLDINTGSVKKEFRRYGRCYNTSKFFFVLLKILQFIHSIPCCKNLGFNIVYANTITAARLGNKIKQALDIPYILHVHESFALSLFDVPNVYVTSADEIIAVSKLCKQCIINKYNIIPEKITIQNPLSIFSKRLRSEKNTISNQSPSPFVIGLSGSDYVNKSFDILPAVVKCYYSLYPNDNCLVNVVGETDKRLKYDIQQAGLQNHIHLSGLLANPLETYKTFDCFLMISRDDSFPLVTQELALLAKPIISFEKVIGANEWMAEAGCIIVPYMDIHAICHAIHYLYEHPEERANRGQSIQARAVRLYEENKSMSSILQIIEKHI